MVHLVYCYDKSKVLEKILSGEKTMVVRGAAGRKIPHSRVFEGETMYFMKKGTKTISASAIVDSVCNFVKLKDEEITEILENNQIEPLKFDHQGNMDDWLIIDKIEDVVVGTSIPYNYEKSRF